MARSIHTTLHALRKLRQQDFSDPKEKAELLRKARADWWRKHRIKDGIVAERRRSEPPIAAQPVDTLPIEFREPSKFLHHAFDEAELRDLLAALPPAATEGLSRIRLSSGKKYIDGCRKFEDVEFRDPILNRKGGEILPGIYHGSVLGVYYRRGWIAIHGYVFDETALARSPMPWMAMRA